METKHDIICHIKLLQNLHKIQHFQKNQQGDSKTELASFDMGIQRG